MEKLMSRWIKSLTLVLNQYVGSITETGTEHAKCRLLLQTVDEETMFYTEGSPYQLFDAWYKNYSWTHCRTLWDHQCILTIWRLTVIPYYSSVAIVRHCCSKGLCFEFSYNTKKVIIKTCAVSIIRAMAH